MSERYNPWMMFSGAFVPNWLMERKEVSPGAKLAFGRLAQYAGRSGEGWPSQEKLAIALAVSEDQAYRYVRELVKWGLIESERRGRGLPNRYHFVVHPWMKGFREGAELEPADLQGQPKKDPADPRAGTPRIRGVPPIAKESLKRVTGAAPKKVSAPPRWSEEAAGLAKAEWDRQEKKPITKFPALCERIQEVLDAGYSSAEIARVLPSMTVFSRNAFDLALRGGPGARPFGVVTDYDQWAQEQERKAAGG